MAVKRLTTEEMVQASGPWVTEGSDARKAIVAVPVLQGLLPRVDAAHKALLEAQPGPNNPRLAALQTEEQTLDLEHDTLIRGTHMLLTALSLLSGSPEAAEQLLRLRDFLLPQGLEVTQSTYRAEAGAGELLKKRLADDASLKKQLKEIPVHHAKQSLWTVVEGWLARANRLGELENERAQIAPPNGPSDGARLVAARNQWIRAVNALVANGELAELDATTDRLIFGALRLAEKAADRRVKAPVQADEEPKAAGGGKPPGA